MAAALVGISATDGFASCSFRPARDPHVALRAIVTAPVVSFLLTENVALTTGGLATVSGLNFRTSDFTQSGAFDGNACATVSWVARSSALCAVGVGASAGGDQPVAVIANGLVGTRTNAFTFDGSCPHRHCLGSS